MRVSQSTATARRYAGLEWHWQEAIVFCTLGTALLLYYFGPLFWLSALGAAVFLGLAWQRLDLALLYAVFTAPFYRYPKVFDPGFLPGRGEALQFSLGEFVILVCFAVWIGRALVSGERPGFSLRSPPILPAIALVGVATISLLVSEQRWVSLREYRLVIMEPFLFLLMALAASRGQNGPVFAERLLDALVLTGTAVGLVGLYHYFFVGIVEDVNGISRMLAVYHSPNALALFLGRVLPLSVVLFFSLPSSQRRRWLYGLAAIVVLVALILTYSRGAWLGMLAALLFVGGLKSRRWLWALLGLGALSLVLLFLASPGRLVSEPSTLQRLYLWQAALDMGKDRPLLGVGLDNFLYQYPKYMLADAWAEPNISHPHNILLDFWTRLGILGVVAAGWLQVTFWRAALRLYLRAASPKVKAIAAGLMASMVDFLVHGLLDNSFFLIDLALVFWLTYGLVMILYWQGGISEKRGKPVLEDAAH